MAKTVEDVLARRTRTLFLNAAEAKNLHAQLEQIMAEEMGEDQNWIENQIENFTTLTQNYQIA